MRPLRLNFAQRQRRYAAGNDARGALCRSPWPLPRLCLRGHRVFELNRTDVRPQCSLRTPQRRRKAQDAAARLAVAQALVHLNFPILDFLAALEAPRGFGVHMMNLDVRMTPGTEAPAARARVTAQARGLKQAADYVDHLSRHPRLGETQLVRHEFIDGDRPGLVQFVVEVAWLSPNEK